MAIIHCNFTDCKNIARNVFLFFRQGAFIYKSPPCLCPKFKLENQAYMWRSLVTKSDRTRQMMLILSRSSLNRSLQNPNLINGFDNRRHIGMIFLRVARHFAKLRYLILGGVGTSVMAAKMVNVP